MLASTVNATAQEAVGESSAPSNGNDTIYLEFDAVAYHGEFQ
jgi:hypothetical protein